MDTLYTRRIHPFPSNRHCTCSFRRQNCQQNSRNLQTDNQRREHLRLQRRYQAGTQCTRRSRCSFLCCLRHTWYRCHRWALRIRCYTGNGMRRRSLVENMSLQDSLGRLKDYTKRAKDCMFPRDRDCNRATPQTACTSPWHTENMSLQCPGQPCSLCCLYHG